VTGEWFKFLEAVDSVQDNLAIRPKVNSTLTLDRYKMNLASLVAITTVINSDLSNDIVLRGKTLVFDMISEM